MFLTIIIFVLVLSVLVFAHEFGHFWSARRFGIRAEEFGFGFPPRAFGFYRNQAGQWKKVLGNIAVDELDASPDKSIRPASTVYSLNVLPLGGFVKIKGENGEGQVASDSFASKKIWQRVIVLAAGVVMNVILAWLLFSGGYLIGLPQSTDSLGSNAELRGAQVIIAQVIPGSVAEQAGLKEGDIVLRINNIETKTEKELQDTVAASANQEAEFLVKRGDQEIIIKATPKVKEGSRATVGIAIFSSGLVRYPFLPAFWEGAKTTVFVVQEIFTSFGALFKSLFQGQAVGDQFAGPVGIANITGQAARLGFAYLLQFTALLSLNLAVLNILPFPALDGGRILFLLVEKLKGKPVRQELENLIHNIGFALLIALVIFITYKDIVKLF
ncbi:MAG: RIP metalloprotease RseP [Patescibacteria group bacterium]